MNTKFSLSYSSLFSLKRQTLLLYSLIITQNINTLKFSTLSDNALKVKNNKIVPEVESPSPLVQEIIEGLSKESLIWNHEQFAHKGNIHELDINGLFPYLHTIWELPMGRGKFLSQKEIKAFIKKLILIDFNNKYNKSFYLWARRIILTATQSPYALMFVVITKEEIALISSRVAHFGPIAQTWLHQPGITSTEYVLISSILGYWLPCKAICTFKGTIDTSEVINQKLYTRATGLHYPEGDVTPSSFAKSLAKNILVLCTGALLRKKSYAQSPYSTNLNTHGPEYDYSLGRYFHSKLPFTVQSDGLINYLLTRTPFSLLLGLYKSNIDNPALGNLARSWTTNVKPLYWSNISDLFFSALDGSKKIPVPIQKILSSMDNFKKLGPTLKIFNNNPDLMGFKDRAEYGEHATQEALKKDLPAFNINRWQSFLAFGPEQEIINNTFYRQSRRKPAKFKFQDKGFFLEREQSYLKQSKYSDEPVNIPLAGVEVIVRARWWMLLLTNALIGESSWLGAKSNSKLNYKVLRIYYDNVWIKGPTPNFIDIISTKPGKFKLSNTCDQYWSPNQFKLYTSLNNQCKVFQWNPYKSDITNWELLLESWVPLKSVTPTQLDVLFSENEKGLSFRITVGSNSWWKAVHLISPSPLDIYQYDHYYLPISQPSKETQEDLFLYKLKQHAYVYFFNGGLWPYPLSEKQKQAGITENLTWPNRFEKNYANPNITRIQYNALICWFESNLSIKDANKIDAVRTVNE